MSNNLVIVESPAKAKTIKKYLGKNYEVIASNGHVRDLPKSQLGIDVENGFEPKYITIRGKGDLLAALRKAVKKADKVYLATDPDREGEAISWHLSIALKLDGKDYKRITFNEITKNAVKESLKQARDIDMNLVDAQQARRALDRLVGYEISPVLWAKIKRGLSAGRVQSVALRLICEREAEIDAFIPEEYWTLEAEVGAKGLKKPFVARLTKIPEGKPEIKSKAEMDKILKDLKGKKIKITSVKTTPKTKKSPLPFTTSTLQQEAARKINFATGKTMRIAQQLYEGVEIKGKGSVGLISYLRTDSVRISDYARAQAVDYIKENYSEEYVGEGVKSEASGKKIQDAHEAIRPTDVTITPADIKSQLSADQYKLYKLIYNRFLASQMSPARYESTSMKLAAGDYEFTANASKLVFEGYLSVYELEDDEQISKDDFKNIDENSEVKLEKLIDKQHFTQPPAHYNEGSLVRKLEELGIGRPSTYAPTISTILKRRYVTKENKNIYVTELGAAVDDVMRRAFPVIVNVEFTSNLESLLDNVEDGTVAWKTVIENFYPDLEEAVKIANKELETIKIEDEVTDEICEECGKNLVVKYGPHGKFLACPGFPDCRFTKPFFERIGVKCPKCSNDIVMKMSKKGRRYYGCINNPDCDFMTWGRPSAVKCEKCGSITIEKGNKLVCYDESCGHIMNKPKDSELS